MKTIAILCGGGPAPGINTVVATVTKVFLKDGYRVLAVHEGYKGLFAEEPEVEVLTYEKADEIYSRGGSAIKMSRFKPKDEDFNTRLFVKEEIELLVTIGGDDTASTANRLTKYLETNHIKIRNIHVPKTIDNDLPLPEGIPTFGFTSAKEMGVRIGKVIKAEAATTQNWYLLMSMGREAGHLAFEIGKGITLREGTDVTIVATGLCVNSAMEAAEKLAADGISAEVINIHTIKPLDEELILASARKTGKVVTVEEHSVIGGLGSAVCDVLSEKLPTPVKKLGVNDTYCESGPAAKLVEKYRLDGVGVYEQVKEFI